MAKASPLVLTGRLSFPERGRSRSYRGGGNDLIPAATQKLHRRRVPLLDADVHRNVTSYGRRTMLSLGRHLYCSYDPVRGAVEELVEAATSSYLHQHRGKDPEFKRQVEEYCWIHDRFCDIAGPPYSMRTYRSALARAPYIDGDIGTLYVRDAQGEPRLQVIPGHRIGSDGTEEHVKGGPYDGAQIIEGVIIDDYSAPLAYRVLTGQSLDYANFVDIPADRMKLSFVPLFPGQLRGFSLLGFSAWSWQDVRDSKHFEMLGQRNAAQRLFQEWNDSGEPPPGSDAVNASNDNTSNIWYEQIGDDVYNNYFRSSDPGSKIEAIKFDRPSANQQNFVEQIIREGLYGAGWSIDYSLLPTKIGGAALRVLVDKLNATLGRVQDLVIEPSARRFDAFRIPVAIQSGRLPFVPDWHLWEYQPPGRLTADRKYDSDVDIQEIQFGIKSREHGAMKRGETHADILASNVATLDQLYAQAQALATKYNQPFAAVLDRLEKLYANAPSAQPGVGAPNADQPQADQP